MEIKSKQICRFCLTTNRPLQNIYKTHGQDVPLSLQIVACVSIEVFPSDKMPVTICEYCAALMGFCYRFKTMCKEADQALKLVPTTKVWPDALVFPQFPADAPFQLLQQSEMVPEEGQILEILSGNEMYSIDSAPNVQQDTEDAPKGPKIKILNNSVRTIDPEMELEVEEEEEEEEDPEEEEEEEEQETPSLPVLDIIYPAEQQQQQKKKTIPPVSQLQKLVPSSRKRPNLQSIEVVSPPAPSQSNNNHQKVLNPLLTVSVKKPKVEPQLKRNKNGNVDIMMEEPPEVLATDVFPCHSCDRSFPLKQLLEIHEKNHSRDRDAACELCPKKFFSKYDLAKHMTTHTGERPFKCVVCCKAFSRSTLLHRHQKTHTDVHRYECPDCDRFFFEEEELEKHAEKHKKARPFSCSYCAKSFAFKQGLERHEMVHAESQPFPCEYCEASFSTRNRLLRHLTGHAGNRPFPCKYCAKSYLMSHHLSRHLRSHAVKEDITVYFTCYRCQAEFQSAELLVDHMVERHPEDHDNEHNCPLCNERFESADEYREHVQLHMERDQFACEFCDLIFIDEEKMMTHSQEDHAEDHRIYDEDLAKHVQKEREATTTKKKTTTEGGGAVPLIPLKKVSVKKEKEDEVYVMVLEDRKTKKQQQQPPVVIKKQESLAVVKKASPGQVKIQEILKSLPKSIAVKKGSSSSGVDLKKEAALPAATGSGGLVVKSSPGLKTYGAKQQASGGGQSNLSRK